VCCLNLLRAPNTHANGGWLVHVLQPVQAGVSSGCRQSTWTTRRHFCIRRFCRVKKPALCFTRGSCKEPYPL